LKTLSDIPKDLQGYAGKARLIDMMDFEKVEFNKAISLNPSNSVRIPILFFHFLSCILLYILALKYTKTHFDSFLSLLLFVLLPGT
ncbi:hypothetical protein VWO27_09930, partial [Campylobacter coli]|nr:hypothetical protein [Campylobacter coli]